MSVEEECWFSRAVTGTFCIFAVKHGTHWKEFFINIDNSGMSTTSFKELSNVRMRYGQQCRATFLYLSFVSSFQTDKTDINVNGF